MQGTPLLNNIGHFVQSQLCTCASQKGMTQLPSTNDCMHRLPCLFGVSKKDDTLIFLAGHARLGMRAQNNQVTQPRSCLLLAPRGFFISGGLLLLRLLWHNRSSICCCCALFSQPIACLHQQQSLCAHQQSLHFCHACCANGPCRAFVAPCGCRFDLLPLV